MPEPEEKPNEAAAKREKRSLAHLLPVFSALIPLPGTAASGRSPCSVRGSEDGFARSGACGYRTSAPAAFAARIQWLAAVITYSCVNQRYPKSSMHSGKSGWMATWRGITPPGI